MELLRKSHIIKKLLFILIVLYCFSIVSVSAKENQLSYGVDLGGSILLYPNQDFRDRFNESLYNIGLRLAGNITYSQIRFEYGLMRQNFNNDNASIKGYQGIVYDKIATKLSVTQQEAFIFFVKNDPERVSFIGIAPISLQVSEQLQLYKNNSNTTSTHERTAHGYKIMVGGSDKDSLLKVTFSYSTARLESVLGHSYAIGGYALSFYLSFDSIK